MLCCGPHHQPFIDQGQVDHIPALLGLPFSPRRRDITSSPADTSGNQTNQPSKQPAPTTTATTTAVPCNVTRLSVKYTAEWSGHSDSSLKPRVRNTTSTRHHVVDPRHKYLHVCGLETRRVSLSHIPPLCVLSRRPRGKYPAVNKRTRGQWTEASRRPFSVVIFRVKRFLWRQSESEAETITVRNS
jgi:hypothetical protein